MDGFFRKLDADAVQARECLSRPLFSIGREEPVCTYCEYKSSCFLSSIGTEDDAE